MISKKELEGSSHVEYDALVFSNIVVDCGPMLLILALCADQIPSIQLLRLDELINAYCSTRSCSYTPHPCTESERGVQYSV